MATKRHKPDEIVTKLRQVEVLRGQGMAMADAVRQIGVSELTYYRWRKQYGGMSRDQLRQLKELQKENERLRKAVADLRLNKLILQVAALEQAPGLTLAGPGIERTHALRVDGLPPGFWAAREKLRPLFPRGIDLILCAGTRLAALPRTTRVTEG